MKQITVNIANLNQHTELEELKRKLRMYFTAEDFRIVCPGLMRCFCKTPRKAIDYTLAWMDGVTFKKNS